MLTTLSKKIVYFLIQASKTEPSTCGNLKISGKRIDFPPCVTYLEKQLDRLDAEEKRITSTRQMLNHILTNHVVMTEAQVEEYLEQMDKLEQEGDEAKQLGADAVIDVKYGSSQVMAGAAEVIAYGTAVKIVKE